MSAEREIMLAAIQAAEKALGAEAGTLFLLRIRSDGESVTTDAITTERDAELLIGAILIEAKRLAVITTAPEPQEQIQ
jgi:hypothetical protein